MDVTRKEFALRKTELETNIKECCFAAIDSEFTGLAPPRAFHPLDTAAERYSKLRKEISNYLIVQLGLSLFTYDEQTGSYAVKTYNFYVFPDGADHEKFMSDSGCIKFLLQHGFDFNRCVLEGLPFMRPAEFEDRKAELKARQRSELQKIIPDCYLSEIDNVLDGTIGCDEIQKATQPPNIVRITEASAEEYVTANWSSINKWIKSKEPELVLPPCSELVRLPFYEHMERVFFNAHFDMEAMRPELKEQTQPGLRKIRLFRSESTPTDRLLTRHKKERQELNERLGISSVLNFVAKSQKPVVLHNCVHDLLLIISQFFAPLPEKYVEFQALCNEIFPNLFDTKFMVQFGTLKQYFRGTRLIDVYNQIKNQQKIFSMPRVNVCDGYGYADETREHEAGYDAWITGYIFAALSQFLLPNKKNNFSKLNVTHSSIVPFRNKIPFASSLDITCFTIDPTIQEDSLNRSSVFVVEWEEHEHASYARALVAQVGGFKKIGYGENVLTFIPNNPKSCFEMLKTAHELPRQCRFYKYSTRFQKVPLFASVKRNISPESQTISMETTSLMKKYSGIPVTNLRQSPPSNTGEWTQVGARSPGNKKRRIDDANWGDCRQDAAVAETDW
ncbi:poly(A)-specific ribonuclease PARN-like [Varroa jacobsoni]|uniref:Uncharacterized protein n=1 Tax=Varroa destructor TaxID=109461 RepID=A0A7M7KGY3_VARDE|nr:poly(A)-specific ribonuclease PARN-like [Varroa destructor]XP_022666662.1 poly(A)-specific ribonuclease PARN-like [Varroa destructor]XP_022666663.1 poly(A)-specific ribonuclease PARN-like [Varroa destructor]XP_022666664.1 poly(A)-specific ribonuclease PARN-like [Varroa destructor]XP_022666665.1 poly(A)-specific ribonuclease PARN-like [Varroa destructor]XP_022666666.1 poly(A)-specific ribonuclease PARN-like [Varroa destructor]XP_022708369.1 poly(A)-specific ribonuclease PARN-like [Varroa ja